MQIVEAPKDYIFVIRSLADRIWPHTFRDILSEKQIAYMMDMMYSISFLEQQMDNGHHYLLLRENDEYLGYLSYELNYKNSNLTKIHKIYILPSLQGKGLGRLFINAVKEVAIQNNNAGLSLNVNRYNKAIEFYTRVGFNIVGSEDIDIGDGFLMEDYIMNLKIE
ncbi:GNAT family N-acetyltransferase [Dysgonomonas sp. Marseille-P4361]|uniref:GNAT family N-acetyltransferase n=1 Tax=Dysgonomonas sp. Marseille-P4361 TaxID=2161820 RepID=UPI000D55003C|nr:GNAT family N-acetyltransferase [Dysgonomonas sp. Marseille-P4361]